MEIETGDNLLILGRQPALGLAELESLYGASNVSSVSASAALVKKSVEIDFSRLGGSVKLCEVLATLETSSWNEILESLKNLAQISSEKIPSGKIQLGVSALGFTNLSPAKINAGGLTIKKSLTKSGRSVRLTPNNSLALSSAQVIHNHLTGANGIELVMVKIGARIVIARMLAEQDIASYTLRDRGRPKRDARVGMLPPKLAQIIINLAAGKIKPSEGIEILDPFCGTGVILQEAYLMGYSVSGTDIDQRMISYAQENTSKWLVERLPRNGSINIETADATNYQWDKSRYIVASEVYLGRPFTAKPSAEILAKTASECNLIIKKFLANIRDQLASGTRLCLAVPAWQISPSRFKRLPLIDQLADLGYNRVDFEHISSDNLIYYRENQVVARELLVLTRK